MRHFETAKANLASTYLVIDDREADALDVMLRGELSRRPGLADDADALAAWAADELNNLRTFIRAETQSADELVAMVESGRRSS